MGLRDKTLRQASSERRAVIDIGSNTVRLVVYGGPPRAPTVVLNEKVSAKLGKGVAETGSLAPKARATALAALGRYAALVRAMGIQQVHTVATAAVREAVNGALFLSEVEALGLKPQLLSGEEEAQTSALGVIGAFPAGSGVVADLGGGNWSAFARGLANKDQACRLASCDFLRCARGVQRSFDAGPEAWWLVPVPAALPTMRFTSSAARFAPSHAITFM